MLTIAFPFYRNPRMLAQHYAEWTNWPAETRDRVRVVIVDDGSPQGWAVKVPRPEGLPELAIYRVAEDKLWWHHAARNIAMHEAPEGWCMLTDVDHVLPLRSAETMLRAIDGGELDETKAYYLDRITTAGKPRTGLSGNEMKPHPNSFLLTRETFWRIGGYDERLCGCYGTDSQLRQAIMLAGARGRLSGAPLVEWTRKDCPDANTSADRKTAENNRLRAEKMRDARGLPPLVLTQKYERVL